MTREQIATQLLAGMFSNANSGPESSLATKKKWLLDCLELAEFLLQSKGKTLDQLRIEAKLVEEAEHPIGTDTSQPVSGAQGISGPAGSMMLLNNGTWDLNSANLYAHVKWNRP